MPRYEQVDERLPSIEDTPGYHWAMPGTIEADGCGASASPRANLNPGSSTKSSADALTGLWHRFSAFASRAGVAATATVALWIASGVTWSLVCLRLARSGTDLGWDLVTSYRAERVFARGGQPYSIAATDHRLYLYPPSALLVLRPLALLSLHQVQLIGLAATAVMTWAAVMLSAAVLGKRWWGFTAAAVVFALRFAEPLLAELGLENVTVVCTLALAAFYLLSAKEHWVLAGAAIGVTLAIKPLLLAVLLVFVLARKWRALAVTVAIPAVLNAAAFIVVRDPTAVFAKLPSLLDRTGAGALLNSAWVAVMTTLGAPDGVTILVRVMTAGVVALGAWWSWHEMDDGPARTITTSSVLLIGTYLAGTLSENHFMLTLVPLAMTAIVTGAPARWVSAWVGVLLLMGLTPPASLLGLDSGANLSLFRALGMTLVVLTVVAALGWKKFCRKSNDAGKDDTESSGELRAGARNSSADTGTARTEADQGASDRATARPGSFEGVLAP